MSSTIKPKYVTLESLFTIWCSLLSNGKNISLHDLVDMWSKFARSLNPVCCKKSIKLIIFCKINRIRRHYSLLIYDPTFVEIQTFCSTFQRFSHKKKKKIKLRSVKSSLHQKLLVCCLAHRGSTGVFLLLRS